MEDIDDLQDPCCAHERELQKKEDKLQKIFNEHDITRLAVENRKLCSFPSCSITCCHDHSNPNNSYESLTRLREYGLAELKSENIEAIDENSDDDDLFDEDDDFLLKLAATRLQHLSMIADKRKLATAHNRGTLLELKSSEIDQSAERNTPLILHLIPSSCTNCEDSHSCPSANIDILLIELARQYPGSIFRFIIITSTSTTNDRQLDMYYKRTMVSQMNQIVVRHHQSWVRFNDIKQYNRDAIMQFLANSSALVEDISLSNDPTHAEEVDEEDCEVIEEAFQCGMEGCFKSYNHCHIAAQYDKLV